MRTLIKSSVGPFAALILSGYYAMAVPATASLQYGQQNAIQLNETSIAQSSQEMALAIPSIVANVNLLAAISSTKQDFSNRNLTYKNGESVPLSSVDSGIRQTANVNLNGNFGNHSGSIGIVQDVKPSLFTSKSLSLSYGLQLYQGATQVKFQFAAGESNQPLSYFIDPGTLESKPRVTEVQSRQATIGVEQIWTESFKSMASVGYKNTRLYRPDETQVKLGLGYAINQDLTLKTEFGYASENRDQKLTFDRGYFQSRWLDAELSYEWSLDSFLVSGVSFLDETEVDPRRNSKTALGTDEFALGVKQTIQKLTYNLKVLYALNSEKQTSSSFSGGVAWSF